MNYEHRSRAFCVQEIVGNGADVATAAEFGVQVFANEIMLTNLGTLSFDRQFGPVTLKALFGPAVTTGFENHQTIGVATGSGNGVTPTSCPFFPSKHTFVSGLSMSALCQRQTSGRYMIGASTEHQAIPTGGPLLSSPPINGRIAQVSNTQVDRAYVELREDDDDGGEMLAVVVF